MKFWKVLYRMFHGKALRFMSGIKSVGQVLRDSSHIGNYDPQETNINFAVPNTQTIINYTSMDYDFPKEIPPGIITSTLELKSKENSYILSVDGKKLAPVLNENNGDQDLFGHETSQTDSLQFSRERIEHEISLVQMTMENWDATNDDEKIEKLSQIIQLISTRNKDLRFLFQKQKMALQKFQREAGEDWRNSRFVYALQKKFEKDPM